jgi:tetratricopeptide (TPR) repeat protein
MKCSKVKIMKQINKSDKLEQILDQVFNLITNNKNQQILPILNQYKEIVLEYSEQVQNKYYKLTAFGYLREKDLIEAENYLEKLSDNDSLDVIYIHTVINFHMREFEKSIENGSRYLDQFENLNDVNEQMTFSNIYRNNILNFVGQSLMMLRRYDEADELFNNAIQNDPNYPPTYINMIRMAEHLKDKETVKEILETALQNCPDSIELKILAGISEKYQNNSYS